MKSRLTYVFDAYCGWCYGFGETFRAFVDSHAWEIDVEVVPGGLFVGTRRGPIRQIGQVARANDAIASLTGTTFGPGYRALVADGSFVMDSHEAARGFLALQSCAPGYDVEIAWRMQSAFYVDGKSLSVPETYADIATGLEVSPDDVRAALERTGDDVVELAYARAIAFGVAGFPSVFVETSLGPTPIVTGQATRAQLEESFRLAVPCVGACG
jgi:putative protein-disulfide isomerase